MPKPCILYYITDRKAFPGDELTRRRRLLDKITEAASAGVDYIQLREKDLSARDLESLAREAIQIIRNNAKPRTALLINSRTDVALATEADGVHLPANDLSPNEIRQIWKCGAGALAREISPQHPQISISCHSPEEVTQAATERRHLSHLRPRLRKKRCPRNRPRRPRSSAQSLPRQNSRPRSRRHHPAERRFLPASRRSRHRRHPPVSGKQHR